MITFTSQKLSNYFKLVFPSDGITTQPFGANQLPLYKELGLLGHMGIDFSGDKERLKASFDGVVHKINFYGGDKSMPWSVSIWSDQIEVIDGQQVRLQACYVHVESTTLKEGDVVKKGDIVAIGDNTGYPKYSTAPHCHFEVEPKYWSVNAWVSDYTNGYNGKVDPQPFFYEYIVDPTRFEGLIVKSNDNPKCYLVEGGKKRWYPSQGAFWLSNHSFSEVNTLQPFEMAAIPLGDNMPDLSDKVKKDMAKLYPNFLM